MKREVNAQEPALTAVVNEFRAPIRVLLGVAKELKMIPSTSNNALRISEISNTIEQQSTRLLTLMNHLSVMVKANPFPLAEDAVPVADPSADFMQQFRDAIIASMSEKGSTVEGIAQLLLLSPSQLRHKMSAFTTMTPKKYMMKVRMEVAYKMLHEHPSMKISAIAERCGFYDLSHFIRFYKETYGVTPAADMASLRTLS